MNPSQSPQKTARTWPLLAALLMASVVASADDKDKDKDKDKKSAPAPSPRPARSAPSKTAAPPSEGAKTEPGTTHSTEAGTEHARPARGAKVEHETPPAAGTATDHGRPPARGAKVEHETPPAKGTSTEHGTSRGTPASTEGRGAPADRAHTDRGTAHPTPATTEHGTTPSARTDAERRSTRPPGDHAAHGAPPAPASSDAHGAAAAHPRPTTTTHEFKSANGQRVRADYRDGHVRSIQAPSMRIDHDLHGDRRIVTEHNGRQIVTVGPHVGYSQRSYYNRGSRQYVQRTYFMDGHRYAYAYRTYLFGGVHYYGYAPAYYYRPAYYGWAYNPWRSPVRYRWGWDDQPWYGYYGSYFSPYGMYSNASLWLTDYILAENLRAAYESRADDRRRDALDSEPAREEQLDPDVKESIAYEVRRQIAAEQSAAANPEGLESSVDQAPPALDSKSKIFVVSTDLDTTMSTGEECALTPGDVLMRTSAAAGDDNRLNLTVASSKKDDCYAGSTVSVDIADLQEMHNHLRQLLDTGLKNLADNSGRNGLPSAPDVTTRAGEVPPPEVDVTVDSDLEQQQSDADRMEREASPRP
jgi:hypothetical protein